MEKIFAWQKGLKGPMPVLFHHGIPVSGEGKKRDENLLVTLPVPADYGNLSLDKLAQLFPYREAA